MTVDSGEHEIYQPGRSISWQDSAAF